jgi:hypothetical protein
MKMIQRNGKIIHCLEWEDLKLLKCLHYPKQSLQMATAAMKLRHLLLGRKSMANLDSGLKSRDISLPTKVHIVKAMFFPVVICENWTIKMAEPQRIGALKLL